MLFVPVAVATSDGALVISDLTLAALISTLAGVQTALINSQLLGPINRNLKETVWSLVLDNNIVSDADPVLAKYRIQGFGPQTKGEFYSSVK